MQPLNNVIMETDTEQNKRKIADKTDSFFWRFYMRYKWQLLIFFALFVPLGVFKFFLPGSLHPTSAIEGHMAGAAMLAGLDWSGVFGGYLYAGFGSNWYLFPLFMFDLSPNTIYIVMGLNQTLLIAFTGVIAYNMMTDIFDIYDKKIAVITSMAAACLYSDIFWSNPILSETMMVFMTWSILYVLLIMAKRAELLKPNKIQSLLLSFLMCYSLLLSTRMLFVWGAVLVFILCYLITSKKMLVNLWVFLPSIVIQYFIATHLINYVQTIFYLVAEGETITNDFNSIFGILSLSTLLFTGFTSLVAMARLIIAYMNNIFALSSGLVYISFAAIVLVFVCLIWKKTRVQTQTIINENKTLFAAAMYSVSLVAATTVLMAYNYLPQNQTSNPDTISFMFDRYWRIGLAPTVVFSIVILYRMKNPIIKKLLLISTGIIIAVSILFAFYVAPLIHPEALMRSGPEWTVYEPLTFWNWVAGEPFEPTPMNFFTMALIASVITLVLFILIGKRKLHLVSMVLLAWFIFNYSYTTINSHIPMARRSAAENHQVYELFSNAEISAEEYYTIYSLSDRRSLANLQFKLYKHHLVQIDSNPNFPHTDISTIPIFITNNIFEEPYSFLMFFGRNYELVVLDEVLDDEGNVIGRERSVFINNNELSLLNRIGNAGYSLSSFDTISFNADGLPVMRAHGEVETNNERIVLSPGEIQFGPYLSLPAGRYQVTITGSSLPGASFFASYYGGNPIDLLDLDISNNKVTYSFVIEHDLMNIEFLTINTGENTVEIINLNLKIEERLPPN